MIDGRLLVPASAAWAASAGASWWLLSGGEPAVGIAVAVVLLGFAVSVLLVRRRSDGIRAVAVTLAAVVLAIVAAAGYAATVRAEPVWGWAQAQATAQVVGTVQTEPDTRATPWGESEQRLVLRSATVMARGATVIVDLPIRLIADPAVVLPPPGSRVLVTGRLAPASPGVAASLRADRVAMLAPAGPVDAIAQAMRDGLRAALAGAPPDAGSLVAGLAIGDESGQSPALTDAMRLSGLAHLTAVSGSNVSIVVIVAALVAAALGMGLVGRSMVALLAVAFFVVVVGPQPSVLRAAVMGGVVTLGALAGGRRAGPSVLCAAVIALVVISPPLATAPGFALSVLATAGLVLLAPILRRRLAVGRWSRAWPGFAQDAVAVTLAAQAGALPVLLLMGAAVGWVSVPANLLAMPAVPPVTVLGLAAAALGPVWPAGADLLAGAAVVPAAWIAAVAHTSADLPGLPSAPVGLSLLLVGAALLSGRLGRRTRLALVAAASAIALAAAAAPRTWPPPGWIVLMCDVGQGSATLLNAAPGAAVLVDTGPDPDAVDRCLDDAGIQALPVILLTHYHRDHVGGLRGALRGRSVGTVVATAIRDPPEQAAEVDALVAGVGGAVIKVAAGDTRTAGAVTWRTLWPRRALGDGPNNASLVLEATVGGYRVLLPGDIERAAQIAVIPDLRDVSVAVVPHHGSADLMPGFAAATGAEIALLSVGAGNDFGHPAQAALEEWSGALLARTDTHGDVAVVAQPEGLAVVVRRGMLPPWQPG